MPHDFELLPDVSEGIKPWFGDCGDQEGAGNVKLGNRLVREERRRWHMPKEYLSHY